MATVSVIIPLYKSSPFIAETLASVQAQTFSDWEIVCVDDCPTESSEAAVEKAAAGDRRIRYHAHSKNMGGPAFGRNTGLALSKSEYVTFLDHDDTFLPKKLELLVAAMTQEEVDFICSNCALINNQTGRQDGLAWGSVQGNPKEGFRRRLLEGNFVPPNSTLIRRAAFAKAGHFDTSLKGVDDYDMWYRLASVVPATIYNEPLATWRYHNAESVSANQNLMLAEEAEFYRRLAIDPKLSIEEKKIAESGQKRALRRQGNEAMRQGKYEEAATYYQKAGESWLLGGARTVPQLLSFALRRKAHRQQFTPLNLTF